MSPDPYEAPNQAGQPQHAFLFAQANPVCFCHPSALVLLQPQAHPLLHPIVCSLCLQGGKAVFLISQLLIFPDLVILCVRTCVILLCVRPCLPRRPSGAEGPGCSLPSSPEASLSLMYQISDVFTSFSFFQCLLSDTALDSIDGWLLNL